MEKKYKIIGTDLYLNGKVYSEGSVIEFDDATAKYLAVYLEEVSEVAQDQSTNGCPVKENIKKSKRSKKQ